MLDKINPPQHFQFIEADVDNLYPSINIEDGLHALKAFLTNIRMHHTQVSLLIRLARWVLMNNYVTFGEETYLQISGTAMGTPCAVVFACIYVHIIEQEAFAIFSSTRYVDKCIFLFKRFIDDIIAIVSDYDTGCALMKILNSRRNSIHFTFKIKNSESQFLDLTLYKRFVKHDQQLAVKAYSKPMNNFLFLPPISCHPIHIFYGWIHGYGRRLRLNCTNDSDFEEHLTAFRSRLATRGYSKDHVKRALDAIPSRNAVLQSLQQSGKQKSASIGIPFVIMYSPEVQAALPDVKKTLSLTKEAHLDPHFPQIFGCRTCPLLSFKRGKNLQDMVAPSTLRSTP
jgi:hypothetical protein